MVRRRFLVPVATLGVLALLVGMLPAGAVARDPARFQRLSRAGVDTSRLKDLVASRAVRSVIVELAAAPVAVQQGAALEAGRKLTKAERAAVRASVKAAQDKLIPSLRKLGATVVNQYQDAYDGIRIRVPGARIAEIAALPGVVGLHPVTRVQRDNAVGVPYIGGDTVWTDAGLTGAGIRIASIDTGVDFYHANFGGSGQVSDFAYGAAHSTTVPAYNADGTTIAYPSAKVAGGWDLVGDAYNADSNPVPVPDPNPLDCAAELGGGHGSHTLGTMAGFGVLADGSTYTGEYSNGTIAGHDWLIGPGVAPQATIYSYRVFGCEGSTDVVVDAIDMAVRDEVDVINMSLGSPFGTPDAPDAVASDNAAKAGIVVVASAGNSGSNAYLVGAPSVGKRVLSVAAMDPTALFPGASTGDITMINANGSAGLPVTAEVEVLLDGSDISLGCEAGDYVDVTGKIVVTQRGSCDRVERAKLGQAAGAAAVILANQEANAGTLPPYEGDIEGVTIPFLGAAYEDQAKLIALDGQSITIDPVMIPNPGYKKVAGFSSGGPSSLTSAVKPEIAAPGVSTLSTMAGGGSKGERLSGTSMAAPFTAGAAALVRQAHPTWSVAQIKGALIGTADSSSAHMASYNVRTLGAGVVQVQKAVASVASIWTKDGQDTVSFGYAPASSAWSDSQDLTITNAGSSPITYTLSRTGSMFGTMTFTPARLTVPAGSSRSVSVKLKFSAAELAAVPPADQYSPTGVATIRGGVLATPESGGAGVYPLSVPFLVAPRGLSKVTATRGNRTTTVGTVVTGSSKVANSGVHAANGDVYAWGLTDRKGDGGPSTDLRDMGVQVFPDGGDSLIVFALNTYGRWSNAAVNEYDVVIDTDGDDTPDFYVVGFDYGALSTGSFDGDLTAFVFDAGFELLDIWSTNAPTNGSTVLLPVLASELGLASGTGSFRYTSAVTSLEGLGDDWFDAWASFDAFAPAVSQGDWLELAPGQSADLRLSVDSSKIAAQPALGWLVVALDDANGAEQAEEVPLFRIK